MKIKLFGAAAAIGALLLSSSSFAATSQVPEPFQGSDETSKYAISYENLNVILDAVVIDLGRSNRAKAPRETAATGSRLTVKVNRWTINEGNRFYYEAFEDNESARQQLDEVKQGIENATADVGLASFTRDEQLAYWLNLYNVTIVNEIVKIYPQNDLKKFLNGKKSILDQKLLVVEGVPLSLNDIEFTILAQNYDNNPLIIYGLYEGIIGSPNVRRQAYTGKTVYNDLADNAVVFINSNRGTTVRSAKKFRVSSFYERNEAFFPNFDSDLSTHLSQYLEGEQLAALGTATSIKADINDWTITDMGGTRRQLGGSLANNSAAMQGSIQGGAGGGSAGTGGAGGSGSSGINAALARQAQENNQDSAEEEEVAAEVDEEDSSGSGTGSGQ